MKYVVLRNKETPKVGILTTDVDFYWENRHLSLIVQYFLLDPDLGMALSDKDRLLVHLQDFNATYEVCVNWGSIDHLSQAKWEQAHAHAFQKTERA